MDEKVGISNISGARGSPQDRAGTAGVSQASILNAFGATLGHLWGPLASSCGHCGAPVTALGQKKNTVRIVFLSLFDSFVVCLGRTCPDDDSAEASFAERAQIRGV